MSGLFGQPPGNVLSRVRRRAEALATVRSFFAQRNVLEVDTPVLGRSSASDPCIDSFEVFDQPASREALYLNTSPEFAMKRLLAAGSGPIYQLGRAFRRGEIGRLHNPEFTMLEWYRPGFDLTSLRQELLALLHALGIVVTPVSWTWRALLAKLAGFDPLSLPEEALRRHVLRASDHDPDTVAMLQNLGRRGVYDWLMVQHVDPWLALQGAVFLEEFPAEQAALSVVRPDRRGLPVAQRFELYLNGVEVANAYEELLDAAELRQRWERDNRERVLAGQPELPVDERLLEAMACMPPCSGIAVGFDRLLMHCWGENSLACVLPVPWSGL